MRVLQVTGTEFDCGDDPRPPKRPRSSSCGAVDGRGSSKARAYSPSAACTVNGLSGTLSYDNVPRVAIRTTGWSKIPGQRVGALARIRTWDTRFRKPVLYPLSYEGLRL